MEPSFSANSQDDMMWYLSHCTMRCFPDRHDVQSVWEQRCREGQELVHSAADAHDEYNVENVAEEWEDDIGVGFVGEVGFRELVHNGPLLPTQTVHSAG